MGKSLQKEDINKKISITLPTKFQTQSMSAPELNISRQPMDNKKGIFFLPVTLRLAEQLSLPWRFEALQVNSPLSVTDGLKISRDEV